MRVRLAPSVATWHWRDAFAVAAAAVMVGLPAIATYDGFIYDFTNHLWLVWVQGHAIASNGVPTYFLHTEAGGVFDPFFVFYGGTLYALTGALAAVLGGSARVAYVGMIVASIVSAYGGILWFARQVGARSSLAHAPALTFVASAYYVTNIYGRGAWPEFVAVSAIPLLVAAGTWIARAPRLKALPCLLFVGAAIIASGSHTITLVWGTIAIVATLATLRLLLARPLACGRGRLGLLLALLALAVGVNGWFLVPNLRYASTTQFAGQIDFSWAASRDFNSPRALFDPLRYVPDSSTAPALFVQAPVWFLAWALVAMLVLRARLPAPLRRGAAAPAIVLAGLLALIMVGPLWSVVPEPLRLIQLPYRLNSYVAMLIAGLVLVAVLALQHAAPRERRQLVCGLAAATAVSVGLCLWQLWVPDTHYTLSYHDLRDALVSDSKPPRTWYTNNVYHDRSAPLASYPPGRVLYVDPATVSGSRMTRELSPPPGRRPFVLNSGSGPGLVDIDGLERIGRVPSGATVARRPAAGDGALQVTFKPTATIRAGLVVSLLAIFGLASIAVGSAVRGRRRRRDVLSSSH